MLSFYRYVDDSHARFNNIDCAIQFQNILNKQHSKIQYTIDKEDGNKVFQFLDIKVINNSTGKYEFDVYRKNAITNVQVKPKSCHDPRVLQGIFKGFVHRAMIICSDKYIKDELAFLKNVFVENGYKENILWKIIEEETSKSTQQNTKKTSSDCIDTKQKQTISLPWIPGVSPKLSKAYRKAGYKVVFKSNKNLQTRINLSSQRIAFQVYTRFRVPLYGIIPEGKQK